MRGRYLFSPLSGHYAGQHLWYQHFQSSRSPIGNHRFEYHESPNFVRYLFITNSKFHKRIRGIDYTTDYTYKIESILSLNICEFLHDLTLSQIYTCKFSTFLFLSHLVRLKTTFQTFKLTPNINAMHFEYPLLFWLLKGSLHLCLVYFNLQRCDLCMCYCSDGYTLGAPPPFTNHNSSQMNLALNRPSSINGMPNDSVNDWHQQMLAHNAALATAPPAPSILGTCLHGDSSTLNRFWSTFFSFFGGLLAGALCLFYISLNVFILHCFVSASILKLAMPMRTVLQEWNYASWFWQQLPTVEFHI